MLVCPRLVCAAECHRDPIQGGQGHSYLIKYLGILSGDVQATLLGLKEDCELSPARSNPLSAFKHALVDLDNNISCENSYDSLLIIT